MTTVLETPLTPENAYEHAMSIIDQEWLEAGVTQAEIDQSKEMLAQMLVSLAKQQLNSFLRR